MDNKWSEKFPSLSQILIYPGFGRGLGGIWGLTAIMDRLLIWLA